MRCSQFKDHYSDFRDRRIQSEFFRRQMESHLEVCTACARFDTALDRGMDLIYQSGEISIPPGFKRRILNDVEQKRNSADPIMPGSAGLAATAMVAAALALIVFESRPSPEPVAQTAVPAAEFRLTRLMPAPQAPHVDFTEFELPPVDFTEFELPPVVTYFSPQQGSTEAAPGVDVQP